jgi:hypothetical protein
VVTSGTPYDAGGDDVSTTLADLERKLRDLERQLDGTDPPVPGAGEPRPVAVAPGEPVAPIASPPQDPAPPAEPDRLLADVRARLGGVGGPLEELVRFREQLQRTGRELEEAYDAVLARIGAAPVPTEPPSETRSLMEDQPFQGAVVVDGGPLADMAALSAFDQVLRRLPGAESVFVSRFDGTRATVELRLVRPIALVSELRAALSDASTVVEAAPSRLRVDLAAPPADP